MAELEKSMSEMSADMCEHGNFQGDCNVCLVSRDGVNNEANNGKNFSELGEKLVRPELVAGEMELVNNSGELNRLRIDFFSGLDGLVNKYGDADFTNEADNIRNVVENALGQYESGQMDAQQLAGVMRKIKLDLESLIQIFDDNSSMRMVTGKKEAYRTYKEKNWVT